MIKYVFESIFSFILKLVGFKPWRIVQYLKQKLQSFETTRRDNI